MWVVTVAQRDGFYLQQKLQYFHSYWHSNNMMYYQYYLSTKDNKTHFRLAPPPPNKERDGFPSI